jgi:hypothetical protein
MAKMKYITNADRYTRFFHGVAKRNAERKFIATKADGVKTASMKEVAKEFVMYYKKLLGTSNNCRKLDPQIVAIGQLVTMEQKIELEMDITPEEINNALWDIGDLKAPGPDGCSSYFFTEAWSIVGRDMVEASLEFF